MHPAHASGRAGRSPRRPWSRSRWGRPWCNCRRTGNARPPCPSARAPGCSEQRVAHSAGFEVSALRLSRRWACRRCSICCSARRGTCWASITSRVLHGRHGARRDDIATAIGPDLDQEMLGHLGQAEVKPGGNRRPGTHRRAEARRRGSPAVDRDHEQTLTPRLVGRIHEAISQEDPILGRQGVEIARSGADHRQRHDRFLRHRDQQPAVLVAALQERGLGGNTKSLRECGPTT